MCIYYTLYLEYFLFKIGTEGGWTCLILNFHKVHKTLIYASSVMVINYDLRKHKACISSQHFLRELNLVFTNAAAVKKRP